MQPNSSLGSLQGSNEPCGPDTGRVGLPRNDTAVMREAFCGRSRIGAGLVARTLFFTSHPLLHAVHEGSSLMDEPRVAIVLAHLGGPPDLRAPPYGQLGFRNCSCRDLCCVL